MLMALLLKEVADTITRSASYGLAKVVLLAIKAFSYLQIIGFEF